jgi:hypothetical protein
MVLEYNILVLVFNIISVSLMPLYLVKLSVVQVPGPYPYYKMQNIDSLNHTFLR